MNSGSGSRQKFRIHADPDSQHCLKASVVDPELSVPDPYQYQYPLPSKNERADEIKFIL